MLNYRDQLSSRIERIMGNQIPIFAIYLLISVPLIIFEEQINCMPAWCGQVLIPPTLPFILLEVLGLGLLSLKLHVKKSWHVAFAYSVFGIFWELFLGGLVGAPLLIAATLAPYVMVSYMFVSLLPLNLLLDKKDTPRAAGLESVGNPKSALTGPSVA